MAERLLPLPATQVAWVRLVWKSWFFYVTLRLGARCKHCNCPVKLDKKNAVAKAKVFPHLEARVHVGRGIPHVKVHNSVLRLRYSKE
jgi:hypothetical protein